MDRYRKFLLIFSMVIWFFVISALIIYNFFPYQKFVRVTFQGLLCGSKMAVSIDGVKWGFPGASVSRIIFGHEALQGKPLFELKGVSVSLAPLSLFKGVVDLKSEALAYGGNVKIHIENIPFIRNSTPTIYTEIKKADLSQYPEGRLPWFKAISGTLEGSFKNKIPPLFTEKQSGNFSLRLKNGEIKEIATKNGPRITIPFKDIVVEGVIEGNIIKIQKISVESMGNVIKGSGMIESNDLEQKVDLKLFYEAIQKNAPLPGKGTITISGNQWATDIEIAREIKVTPGGTKKQ
ncbi:MAG: type II secretion system protein GspN [Syntrophorhabdaceae bacterium]|nr:type II secretion system protein GspN [Syntrophorhabdaceae bacterium]